MGKLINEIQLKQAANLNRPHLAYLDGLRALCALFVIAYHAYLAVFINTFPTGITTLISYPALYGHLSVPVFIVISGFCLMLPVTMNDGSLQGSATLFFYKRARRIIPPYYSAMILFILGHFFIEHESIPIGDILSHSLLIHNLYPEYIRSKNINPSFWSIAVEWQIYFLFPILVVAWKSLGGIKVSLGFIAGAYFLHFVLDQTFLQGMTINLYALFVFGMLGAAIAYGPSSTWYHLRSRYPAKTAVALSLFIIITLMETWGVGTENTYQVGIIHLFVAIWTMSLLVWMSYNSGPAKQFLAYKPLVFLGSFSYSIYLLHQPFLNIILRGIRMFTLKDDSNFLLLLVFGIPLIIVLSYLFYLVAERPFTNSYHSFILVPIIKKVRGSGEVHRNADLA